MFHLNPHQHSNSVETPADTASPSVLPPALIERITGLVSAMQGDCELGLADAGPVVPGRGAGIECAISSDGDAALYFHESAVINSKSAIVIKGSGHRVIVAAKAQLEGCTFDIGGESAVVVIGPGAKLRNLRLSLRGRNTAILIGAQSTWVGNGNQVMCEGDDTQVIIGDDSMMAHGVIIRTSDGHSIFDRSSQRQLNVPASVVIGPHVWLANSVRINKGTRIGAGTVVGQCSVASGRLDAQCVYAGVPARKVREGIVWSRSAAYDGVPKRFR